MRTPPVLEATERPLRPPLLARETRGFQQEACCFGETGGPTALSIAHKGKQLRAQVQQLSRSRLEGLQR